MTQQLSNPLKNKTIVLLDIIVIKGTRDLY